MRLCISYEFYMKEILTAHYLFLLEQKEIESQEEFGALEALEVPEALEVLDGEPPNSLPLGQQQELCQHREESSHQLHLPSS